MFNKIKRSLKQNIGFFVLSHFPWQFCDLGFSGRLIVEPTDICNLRCPLCPTPTLKREKGFLSLENFKRIVDDIPGLKSINFGWAGEPLLNKEIFKMVKYADSQGIQTRINTNTVLLNQYIDEALDSGLNNLIVCLDGTSKETHEKYRVGSNFESIKKNIKDFCAEKKRRGLKQPEVTLKSLVTKDNEKKMTDMIELAENLGVDNLEFKTISLSLSTHTTLGETIRRAGEFLPSSQFSRYNFKDGKPVLKSQSKLCSWLRQGIILWNGDVVLCCYDIEGDLVVGNVFKDGGFKKIWKSEKYKKYRQKIIKKELALCKNCNLAAEATLSTYVFSKSKP